MGFREDRPQDTGSKRHDEGVQRVMGTRKRRAYPEHFQRMHLSGVNIDAGQGSVTRM